MTWMIRTVGKDMRRPSESLRTGPYKTDIYVDMDTDNLKAPQRITATKYVADQPAQGVAQTRPLCAYPRVVQYRGAGDPNDAASFTCAPGGQYDNPQPAAEYLR